MTENIVATPSRYVMESLYADFVFLDIGADCSSGITADVGMTGLFWL